MLRAVAALALVAALTAPSPAIVAVAPNPVAPDDRGEHLTVAFPRATDLSNWSVTDGESVATLPNRTVEGRVVLTTDPVAVRNLTDHPVVGLDGRLALANAGDAVALRHDGQVVDRVAYDRAPEGERYRVAEDRWEPLGVTDRPVVRAADVAARVFVLPDDPVTPVAALRSARDRILLAGYTLTSRRVVRALCAAREGGVAVRVLVEGAPIGGLTAREVRRLDRLAACGVDVRALGGPYDRYATHHAKYAVIDDRALVLTENWKPAGVGGRSSRGWGVLVDDPRVAASLAATFRADAGFRDAVPWDRFRENLTVVTAPAATGDYPARFEPRGVRVDRVVVLVAPDNAERAVVARLDAATDSIRVQQVSIANGTLLDALLRAARRGVRVRILLSSAWYVRGENARLAARLTERARREGLPLRVRLAEPRSRFAKTHVKGVVVDGDQVILGSANWNPTAFRGNREVLVVLSGEAVGRYYARVFRADWRGGAWRLPAGFAGAAAAAALLGGLAARRAIRG